MSFWLKFSGVISASERACGPYGKVSTYLFDAGSGFFGSSCWTSAGLVVGAGVGVGTAAEADVEFYTTSIGLATGTSF